MFSGFSTEINFLLFFYLFHFPSEVNLLSSKNPSCTKWTIFQLTVIQEQQKRFCKSLTKALICLCFFASPFFWFVPLTHLERPARTLTPTGSTQHHLRPSSWQQTPSSLCLLRGFIIDLLCVSDHLCDSTWPVCTLSLWPLLAGLSPLPFSRSAPSLSI